MRSCRLHVLALLATAVRADTWCIATAMRLTLLFCFASTLQASSITYTETVFPPASGCCSTLLDFTFPKSNVPLSSVRFDFVDNQMVLWGYNTEGMPSPAIVTVGISAGDSSTQGLLFDIQQDIEFTALLSPGRISESDAFWSTHELQVSGFAPNLKYFEGSGEVSIPVIPGGTGITYSDGVFPVILAFEDVARLTLTYDTVPEPRWLGLIVMPLLVQISRRMNR